jgi:lipoprotein-anchoring transpeptidase ErfK/SrfK
MIQAFLATMTLILGLSPIWPIEANLSYGEPFIIVNKSTNHLAFFNNGKLVMEVPVATGVTNDLTPEGEFTIIVKAKDPYYRKKDIPGGDPRNPLGARWIGFDAKGTDGRIYGIHGTNNPASIGHHVSHGCIRMRNEQIKELYELVPIGTKVLITRSSKGFWQLAKEKGAV